MGYVEKPAIAETIAQSASAEINDAITLMETIAVGGVIVWAAWVAVDGLRGLFHKSLESEQL